jgi:hypothetical protein
MINGTREHLPNQEYNCYGVNEIESGFPTPLEDVSPMSFFIYSKKEINEYADAQPI